MPLYFFWGEEDYLIEKEVKTLKKKILGDSFDALNYRTLDNPDFAEFDEALRSTPMFFGDVLYVIKADKYFLETKSKIKLDDAQNAMLCDSFKNVAQGVHIILLCQVPRGEKKKPDSRKKIYKALASCAQIKEFPAYRAYEEYKIAPVLKTLAKEKDITLANDVISLLIQYCGANIRDLDMQLEKLKLSVYPKKQITADTVKDVCLSGEDIFSLPDLILNKEYTSALAQISKILQKSHYLEVIAFLQTSFSNLLKTKVFSKTLSPAEISRKTGQHEFVVKKNIEKLGNITTDELLNIKLNLTDAEYMLKTGQTDAMSAFCRAFCRGADNGR
mgnify:FL=1